MVGDETDRAALLAHIGEALARLDIDLHAEGDDAVIEIDGRQIVRELRWIPGGRPSTETARLLGDGTSNSVFVAERIGPGLASRIRDAGGWYLDRVGRMYIRAPGVRIDTWGRPSGNPQAAPRDSPRNLMSPRRAQVVFALLTWERLIDSPVRYIAEIAGVSAAQANTTMRLLDEQRYLSTGTGVLVRREELVDLWAATFPFGLGRALELGRFVGAADPSPWTEAGLRVYTSGEYATEGLTGPDLTLYVPHLEPRAIARGRWRRPQPGETANVTLRHTFWTDPDRAPDDFGPRAAPPLLVYGDLLASTDPRHKEVAAEVRTSLV